MRNRNAVLVLIAVAISVTSILLYANRQVLIDNYETTFAVASVIIGAISSAYNFSNRFYVLITKLWVIMINGSARWSVTTVQEGNIDFEKFNSLISLINSDSKVRSYNKLSDNTIEMSLEGINYKFSFSEIGENLEGQVYIEVKEFISSYDNSIKVLDDEIIPLFKLIENHLKANSHTYNFKIRFKNKNPFVRIVMRNVALDKSFSVSFRQSERTRVGRQDLQLTEDSISCTTTDFSDFQKSSTNYISLIGG